KMLGAVLRLLRQSIVAGMSTQDLADIAAKELKTMGGKPAFLGYHGFPDVLCVSLNDEVIHGIPSRKKFIQSGDVVSMDFGVVYNGMITDAAITTIEANGSSRDRLLIDITKQSLDAGIDRIKAGVHIGDLSSTIQQELEKH